MSSAPNSIYFLITNALLPHSALLPVAARPGAGGRRAGVGAGDTGGRSGAGPGGCAGRGQPPQPRGGRQRGPSLAGAARPPRRLPHGGKPPPAAPPGRGGVLGTPKGSHLAPRPRVGVSAHPAPPAPSGRGGPLSRSVPPRRAPPAVLPREELPGVGEEEVTGRERSGAGPGLRGASPAEQGELAGSGHRPSPNVAAPAPPAGNRCVNECRNE